VGLPSIVSTIDFDLESDSFSDLGPANGRTPMCQASRSETATAKITEFCLMISTGFDKGVLPPKTC
jgi:hypothetical protein